MCYHVSMETLSEIVAVQMSQYEKLAIVFSVISLGVSFINLLIYILSALRNRLNFDIFAKQYSMQDFTITIANKSALPFSIRKIEILHRNKRLLLKQFNQNTNAFSPYINIPVEPFRVDGDDICSVVLTPEINISALSNPTVFKIYTNRKTVTKKVKIVLTMTDADGDDDE